MARRAGQQSRGAKSLIAAGLWYNGVRGVHGGFHVRCGRFFAQISTEHIHASC